MNIVDIIDHLPRHPTKRYKRRDVADIRQIILHHSGTPSGTPEAFARYHVETLGWPGIGYAYVLQRDGTVYKTQPATVISYHAKGANTMGLGVCLVGNFDVSDPTQAQLDSLFDLLVALCRAYHVPPEQVIGHREVPGTRKSCPGRNVDMNEVRRKVRAMLDLGSPAAR